jgi:hypothetical protein
MEGSIYPMTARYIKQAIFTLLLLAGFCVSGYGQTKERWNIKTLTDGFSPASAPIKKTVADLAILPVTKVGNQTVRLPKEKSLIEISGVITRIAKEADGDLHIEIKGNYKDSTLVCEFVDPLNEMAAESPYLKKFIAARRTILGKKIGDSITVTGVLFQDKFHSPSPHRIRNFLEIHPVLECQ